MFKQLFRQLNFKSLCSVIWEDALHLDASEVSRIRVCFDGGSGARHGYICTTHLV